MYKKKSWILRLETMNVLSIPSLIRFCRERKRGNEKRPNDKLVIQLHHNQIHDGPTRASFPF